jgi:transcription-repair coupling factor (superfamily II helicase)
LGGAQVLEKYKSHKAMQQLLQQVVIGQSENNDAQILLKNLQTGAASYFFSAWYQLAKSTVNTNCSGTVVVCNTAEEAAYFHNNIEHIINPLQLYYFPSSYKNPKNFTILNSSHIMLRSEALSNITKQNNFILVTYPEALIEKVPAPQQIANNTITLKQSESIELDTILELLVSLGFERTDFAYEPGQFAMRGGILDIYSFGNDKPYRIELFGNEVESIRIFDPETQLSERKLLQVNILPNVETHFEDTIKISLLDYLPKNTIWWMQDVGFIEDKLTNTIEDILLYLQNAAIAPKENFFDEDHQHILDISVGQLIGKIAKDAVGKAYTLEELEPNDLEKILALFDSNIQLAEQFKQMPIVAFEKLLAPSLAINCNTQLQPSFNRKFDLLISNLQSYIEQEYTIYLFADNPRQLERLHSIFTDLNAAIPFINVPLTINSGFIDNDLKIVCYTDHQIFQRYHKYKIKQAYNKSKAITMRVLKDLQPGDFVTHIDHGVGTYSGLQKINVNGKMQEAIRLIYKDKDILYVNINSLHKIAKYSGKEGHMPKINKLGSDVWAKLKEKTKVKVKEVAFDLIALYAKRKASVGFSYAPDNYMQTELEASFIYEDTPDQSKATIDVKRDMESPSPMDRLVCGDVGFGKTEIAIRAAFKACCDSKQAAILVPTTILAFQHYKTFKERLKEFPVQVDFVNRFKTTKEKKETFEKLAAGKIDIIIGTHALLSKDVKFKDLGVLIIDEEQKFGVTHKDKIKLFKNNVDCLTLTATPIPRTLQFSLMGARDLSVINTPPPNRQPIETEVRVFQEDFIRDAIYYEVERGGQVFFIHNRVQSLPEMQLTLQGLCPDLSIGMAHGQLDGDELENRILDFIDKKYDVLICTNIVESGVDIPNVNTIIVNNSHQFGLSDLHQLRGRVGRSNKKAFCYLLAPPLSTLPSESKRRLQTLEQHSELGSGFQIAMRDLDIRGAGNMLGGEQSGFMNDIGFETYQKILNEAIRELKRTKFQKLFAKEIAEEDDFVNDCVIETDLEILIPDTYVENITERLSLYTRLDNLNSEDGLTAFHQELRDRFGAVPKPVEDLFTTVRCRKMGLSLGFERMTLKERTLKCHFVNRPDSPYFESQTFRNILTFVQTQTNKANLKQTGRLFLLVVQDVGSMESMLKFLKQLHQFCSNKMPETATI